MFERMRGQVFGNESSEESPEDWMRRVVAPKVVNDTGMSKRTCEARIEGLLRYPGLRPTIETFIREQRDFADYDDMFDSLFKTKDLLYERIQQAGLVAHISSDAGARAEDQDAQD